MNEHYTFGELLKGYRSREGMSQEDLAASIRKSRNAIGDWERGKYLPATSGIASLIGEALNLTSEEVNQLRRAIEHPMEYGAVIDQPTETPPPVTPPPVTPSPVTPLWPVDLYIKHIKIIRAAAIVIAVFVIAVALNASQMNVGIVAAEDPYFYYQRATEEFNKENYGLAIDYYTKILLFNNLETKAKGMAFYGRGRAWLRKAEPDEAIEDFSRAIDYLPDYSWAYFARGKAYYDKNDSDDADDAIENFTFFIDHPATNYPEGVDSAYFMRGSSYFKQQDYKKAIEDMNFSIQYNDEYAWAYYTRGMAYKLLDEKEKAIDDFKKVLDLPKDGESHELAKYELEKLGYTL
jgi:tetratricopeptide (TPR) repeat protein